jgi:selenide,water dikinase
MAINAKRARVMSRSKRLGHCICDPRKACPCELLLEKNVCTCAGERLDGDAAAAETIALTKLVKNAGCASKIAPADLARVLARLPAVTDPRVLVGARTADDAGVFQVSPDLCLVQTVDVFAPCVDDPYEFGRIAACNSLSDVYAMGGTPLTALSIVGYPIHSLADEWMFRMLKGGMDALAEAEVALVGGHSINDEEIKFGFAITGVVDPREMVTNADARPGDALILTKPLGTGIICFAAQIGHASDDSIRAAAESMMTLNRAASEVMRRVGARACTDVTGFGLLGHLYHIVRESGVTAEVWWDAAPTFPGVRELAEQGMVSGAAERNREFVAEVVQVAEGTPDYALDILYDAQTSGGLLMAVPGNVAERAVAELRAAGCPDAVVMGQIIDKSKGKIAVKKQAAGTVKREKPSTKSAGESAAFCAAHGAPVPIAKAGAEECCASDDTQAATATASEAFQRFMAAAFAPGALDVVQKELMTIALSVAVQCEPCLRLHLDKARAMGITEPEIEEAAWMGVAFGGCKAMMFWQDNSRPRGT